MNVTLIKRRFAASLGAMALLVQAAGGAPITDDNVFYLKMPYFPLTNVFPEISKSLDLNGDGIPDVFVDHQYFITLSHDTGSSADYVTGLNGASIALDGRWAAAFSQGQLVGPANTWSLTNTQIGMIDTATDQFGVYSPPPFLNPAFINPGQAIGVKIPVGGGLFDYAWLGIESIDNGGGLGTVNQLVLNGSGYESSLDTPIAAAAALPEPSGLAVLALGAAGLAARVRSSRQRKP